MSAIGSVTNSTPAASNDAYSTMASEDFIKVMFAELTNQDPLSPNDSQALLDQISTIRSIESDQALASGLAEMVGQNELTSASSLVGKFVTGQNESNTDVAGYVDSVSVTREGPILNLSGGHRVPIANLTEIIDPALLENSMDNGAPTVAQAVPDQVGTEGSAFLYTVPGATFSDEESADALSYSATLSDGSDLPAWLSFDPATRTFTGTPGAGDVGQLTIRLTAIDSFNERASTTFTVNIVEGGG